MSTEDRELTQEELDAQAGEALPKREAMSLLTTNPGLVAIPEDPFPADPPVAQSDPDVPPPGHDV